MTMITALATSDRIVILADGKSIDTETGKEDLNVKKIFELPGGHIYTISGVYLNDVESITSHIRWGLLRTGTQDFNKVQEYLVDYIRGRAWADSKEPKKAKLFFLLAGYVNNVPYIVEISSLSSKTRTVWGITCGSWEGSQKYFESLIPKNKDYTNLSYKDAEEISAKVLTKSIKNDPLQIGGAPLMCHLFQHAVVIKNEEYINEVNKRVGLGV